MLDQGIKPDSASSSRAIGYRQALLALQHWHSHPQDATAAQLVRATYATACVYLAFFAAVCQYAILSHAMQIDLYATYL